MECNASTINSASFSVGLPATVIIGTILCISMMCTIIGNILVIAVIARHKGMQTRTNLFLLNLAIADFMVGILMTPFSLTTLIMGRWIFGKEMCTINGFLNAFCYITSIHTLMYISIHKYFSITRPFSRFLNVYRIVIMMAAAWIWAGVCATLTVTGLTSVCYKPGTTQCGPIYPRDGKTYAHHTLIQISNIFIPLTVLLFTYISMFREIHAHTRRLQENTRLEKDIILAQQKKVFITLFIVLACYILCWIPYHIYAMYVTIHKSAPPLLNATAYMFAYINSACNPIIYALRSPSFRQGYKEILCCQKTIIFSDGVGLRRGTLRADSNVDFPYVIRRSQYPGVISETIHDESPSVFRRFTSLFGSRARKGSESNLSSHASFASLQSAVSMPRNFTSSELPLSKANSVIKRDGSVVLMKKGKIVCIRQQKLSMKNPKSPVYYPDGYMLPQIKTNPSPPPGNFKHAFTPQNGEASGFKDQLKSQVGYLPEVTENMDIQENESDLFSSEGSEDSVFVAEGLPINHLLLTDVEKAVSASPDDLFELSQYQNRSLDQYLCKWLPELNLELPRAVQSDTCLNKNCSGFLKVRKLQPADVCAASDSRLSRLHPHFNRIFHHCPSLEHFDDVSK